MLSNQSSVASGENQKVKFGSYVMQSVRAVFSLVENKTPRLAVWGVTSGTHQMYTLWLVVVVDRTVWINQ